MRKTDFELNKNFYGPKFLSPHNFALPFFSKVCLFWQWFHWSLWNPVVLFFCFQSRIGSFIQFKHPPEQGVCLTMRCGPRWQRLRNLYVNNISATESWDYVCRKGSSYYLKWLEINFITHGYDSRDCSGQHRHSHR